METLNYIGTCHTYKGQTDGNLNAYGRTFFNIEQKCSFLRSYFARKSRIFVVTELFVNRTKALAASISTESRPTFSELG